MPAGKPLSIRWLQATALLERDRAGLRGELKNTEVAIRERDATISALKAEAQQLAKFRQVLEYELLQVKEQVAEKEARITQLQLEMKVRFRLGEHLRSSSGSSTLYLLTVT